MPPSSLASRVMLLVIDPFHACAYWELALADRVRAMERLLPDRAAEAKWVLRFFEVAADGRAASHFDIEIDPHAKSWYVEFWTAGKTYYAELGLRAGAEFASSCRSNVAELPPSSPPLPAAPKQAPPPVSEQAPSPSPLASPQAPAPAPRPAAAAHDAGQSGEPATLSAESAPSPVHHPPARVALRPVLGDEYAAWLRHQLAENVAAPMVAPVAPSPRAAIDAPAEPVDEGAPPRLVSNPSFVAPTEAPRPGEALPAAPPSAPLPGFDGLASMRPGPGPTSHRNPPA